MRKHLRTDESGMALLTVLLVCMLASALMAGMFAAISSDQRSLGLDRDQSQAYAAAHAGLEKLTMEERFGHGNWDTLVTGAPALVDAVATYDCRIVKLVPHATHTIMIGEVAALRLGSHNPALVYMDRSYRTL